MLEVGETSVDASYVKRIFLHELYHFIEYRFNVFKDRLWLKNFGAGYTNGYSAQSAQSRIGSGKKGLLNNQSELEDEFTALGLE